MRTHGTGLVTLKDVTGYSVRNGYRSIVGDYVSSSNNFYGWPALWKIKVPLEELPMESLQ